MPYLMPLLPALLLSNLLLVGAATADPAAGRALAERHCARCHAVGPIGASPVAEAPPFRQVVTRYKPEHLEEALAEGIVVGHPIMPEFVFEPGEIGALTAYLETLARLR